MPSHPSSHGPMRIGIVGTGWRTEFFRRALAALHGRVEVGGLLAHRDTSATAAAARWGVPATSSFDEFARTPFDFVVVAVPRAHAPALVSAFVRRQVPVLLETPPAADLPGLRALYTELGEDAPLQVAEQYRYQPQHAARLAVARSGVLGPIESVSTSVAHDYHAVSLIRAFLGAGFEPVEITAQRFGDRLLASLGPAGWAGEERLIDSVRTVAQLRFADGRLGTYDFEDEQYFSPIRSRHISVRGRRGELADDAVRWLAGPADALNAQLVRRQAGVDGDLEGHFLDRITLGADVLYRNPFPGARLSDDEVAIATVVARMATFVCEGTPFYGLADAAHDAYTALLIHEAAASGRPIDSERQPWSDARSVLEGTAPVSP